MGRILYCHGGLISLKKIKENYKGVGLTEVAPHSDGCAALTREPRTKNTSRSGVGQPVRATDQPLRINRLR